MPDPFRSKGSQPKVRTERGGEWPKDYLFSRLALLFPGRQIDIMEDLIVAFGDPDGDPSAADVFSCSDSELRRLVKIAQGDDPDTVARATIDTGEDDEAPFDPTWTIPQLLEYVGTNTARASDVLNAETESAHPRSTLVAALERILSDG